MTRTPKYRTPTVTIADFSGEQMLEIASGHRSVLIRPEDAQAVVMAMGMGLRWLGKLPTSHQGVERP